jgi:glycosyltransferase involved in cell wall biosynthesis
MRIVHVVQGLGIGGQERLVVQLSHELAARGHEPSIVTLSPGGAVRKQVRGVPVYDAPRRPGADPSLALRLAALFHKLRADVVHTHNPAPMLHAVPASLVACVPRRVHTKHGANVYGTKALWAARALVRMVDAIVAVSPETAAIARSKERVPARVLRVVPNGIPLDDFAPDAAARARVRADLGIPAEAFVIGWVGRLSPEKDVPHLVRAASPLLGARVRLVLVGDGPARVEVERAVPPEVARWVTLTGVRADVSAYFAAFDLFALSSRTEGLPLAVPEAMATGLPVVATAVGGLPSSVTPDCGLLVPAGEEAALRRALVELVRDPALAQSMGRSARRRALAVFSIAKMADSYESLYAER